MNNYIFFIIFTICQYIMDRSTFICKTYNGEMLLLFHHFFAVYLYFGGLLFNPFIHLIIVLCVLIHWYTYGKCILTEYTNIYCGVDIDRPFNDIIRMLKIDRLNKYIHWLLLFIIGFYDLCLIID